MKQRAAWIMAVALLFVGARLLFAEAEQETESVTPSEENLLDPGRLRSQLSEDILSVLELPSAPEPVEEEPEEDPWVDYQLREAYRQFREGHSREAVDIFQRVLEERPNHRKARFGLSTIYIQLERYREAADMLERMIVEYPDDYKLRNNLAWLYATAKDESVQDLEKAVELAQDALFHRPGDYHVWSTLAEAHYEAGNYEKAMRAALQAVQLATEQNVEPAQINKYQEQFRRCREAARAVSVVE